MGINPSAMGDVLVQKACVYAALILYDAEVEITANNLKAIVEAAGLKVEPYWYSKFARTLDGADLKAMLTNVGAGGGAAASAAGAAAGVAAGGKEVAAESKKAEEKSEESEIDMGGGGLFGDDDEDW